MGAGAVGGERAQPEYSVLPWFKWFSTMKAVDFCNDFATDALFGAFWAGVDQHEQGVKIGNAHIDESK